MKRPSKRLQILLAVALLLYACGYVTPFIGNYAVWQKNGGMLGGTSPPFPSLTPLACLKGILWFPYSLYCMAGCAAAVTAIFLYRKLFSQDALTDSERNFDFSAKGTYGTSGWMQPREVPAVLDMVSDLSQHTGTVLGMLNGKYLCIPGKTRMNGNLAVYGASGSMKTRSFCMNRILQSAARGESLIICDPKSELYEKSSEYMRDLGYTVRVFNLVSPENSDSWNCLKEIEGQELMAQLFVDVIIKNTNGTGKSDRFWDSGEMNLLKALVLYVDLTYPPEQRNIGEVYNLITQCSESQLDSLFDVLPLTHPAKAPYSLYQRASDSVRSGVISGLGSRLQVFQSELIKKITAYDEISLELPGQQPCAYYLVTSDQDSTFDFLASLFLSFAFIKLVRYADANCPGGRLPVPVHVLGEELTACGTISELSRRISVIRSRNISMSCVFQNLAGLQNRYPQNQWQEILGNCDVQFFLGCTDQLTAEYVSQRTGIASVAVSSTSKALSTLRVSDYTPQYREDAPIPAPVEEEKPAETPPPRRRRKADAPVLTIESGDEIETADAREAAAWHEIHNAYRTRRILSAPLGGIEQTDSGKTIAVVDYNGFRIVIPLKEMMVAPNAANSTDSMAIRQMKLLGNMLGAEIDFVILGIDSKSRSVVASRREAMMRKRQLFYLSPDANGEYRVREGRVVQARVIAVADKSIRVEIFGVECSIMARDLAWDWIGDAHDRFAVGDQILVRVTEVNKTSQEELSVHADVKSVTENTSREALKRCRVQSKYAGRVTDVHKGIVYVRLSNGVNAVAHSCYDRRTPGKKDDVSFVVTKLDEERSIAVGIITRIIRQNL